MSGDFAEIMQELEGRTRIFSIEKYCFKEQIKFIRDKCRYKVAVCSRRAGKTVGAAMYLLDTALAKDGSAVLYITLSRLNAKKIIWGELLHINRQHNLGGKINEAELSIRFPNGAVIYLSGAKDKSEIEKFRGLALALVIVDESQSFRSYIEELVDDVLSKALFDHNGSLCLIGTPGPIPSGYFYDCSKSYAWSAHHWTMLDNPHLERKSGKKPLSLIEEDCARMGVTIEDPKIRRECFGEWSTDDNALVFRYRKELNDFSAIDTPNNYVIGVDIGFEDADAIAVIGWKDKNPKAYLVEEIVKTKQGITDLAEAIERLIKKYDPISVVMDTGGLGKKIAEELKKRYALPIKAAEKTRKFEYIELLNDAMRTGRFYARATGSFAQDCLLVEWDKDKTNGDRLVISDSFHSDICDSVLYAFRESLHWIEVPAVPRAAINSPEWFRGQEDAIVEELERRLSLNNRDDSDPANWEAPDLGDRQWIL